MADQGANFLQSIAPLIDRIKRDYPQLIPFLSDPGIAQIILEGAAKNQSPAQFQGAVQASDWYKSKPPSERTWITTQLIDPARAGQLESQVGVRLHQAARIAGVHLSPDQFSLLTTDALQGGWDGDANEIQRRIVDLGRTQKLGPGQISATQTQLRQVASNYGIPIGGPTLRDWAVRINDGSQTAAGFEDYARSQAKLAFPGLADLIDKGHTVKDIADPYAQIASSVLGVDPNTLDWGAPKWQAALQGQDANGKPTGLLTHQDWQKKLVQDPTYGYYQSDNGKSAAYQLVNTLAQGFAEA